MMSCVGQAISVCGCGQKMVCLICRNCGCMPPATGFTPPPPGPCPQATPDGQKADGQNWVGSGQPSWVTCRQMICWVWQRIVGWHCTKCCVCGQNSVCTGWQMTGEVRCRAGTAAPNAAAGATPPAMGPGPCGPGPCGTHPKPPDAAPQRMAGCDGQRCMPCEGTQSRRRVGQISTTDGPQCKRCTDGTGQ